MSWWYAGNCRYWSGFSQHILKSWFLLKLFPWKEPETHNWRYSSEDIHLFHQLINPYLMDLYPQTKVVSTSTFSFIQPALLTSENWVVRQREEGRGRSQRSAKVPDYSGYISEKFKVWRISNKIFCYRSDRAHLDYHQDDEERAKFYSQFPLPPRIIMGDRHGGYILKIWGFWGDFYHNSWKNIKSDLAI